MKKCILLLLLLSAASCKVEPSAHDSIYADKEMIFFNSEIFNATNDFFRTPESIFDNDLFFDSLFNEIKSSNLFLNYEIIVNDKLHDRLLYQKKYEKIKIDNYDSYKQLARTIGNMKRRKSSQTFYGCTFYQNFSKKEGIIVVYDITYHDKLNVIFNLLFKNGEVSDFNNDMRSEKY